MKKSMKLLNLGCKILAKMYIKSKQKQKEELIELFKSDGKKVNEIKKYYEMEI